MEECKAFHLPLVCSPQTPSQASSGTLSHQYYLDQPSDQCFRGNILWQKISKWTHLELITDQKKSTTIKIMSDKVADKDVATSSIFR